MKANKLYFIIGLLLLPGQFVYSQKISIDLSVKWENGSVVFNQDSIISIPELQVTYRNNSSDDYYFLKVSSNKKGYPLLPWGTLLQYPIEEYINPDYLKRAKSYGSYSNKNYRVMIGGSPLYSNGWIVYSDMLCSIAEAQEINVINDALANIYYYLYSQQYGEDINYKLYFSEEEIGNKDIADNAKKAFVFLGANETYTEVYNLIAFHEVEGNFTFQLNIDKSFDYVLTDPIWDKEQAKYIEKRIILPKRIGKYKLYSGTFISNKISIAF